MSPLPKEPSSIYRTQFYSDCLGVFQGGGCRAAAYAGAYEAAHQLGVRFSEVAGTSAGAIVASLIAAGAEPPHLLKTLRTLVFSDFLQTPKVPFFPKYPARWPLRVASFFGSSNADLLASALSGGLHSSGKIGAWVEAQLQILLGQRSATVQFTDLQ